jgi:ABC-type Mn2+/Zn2+ transport system permease subunit
VLAITMRLPATQLYYLLLILVAVTIVVSLRTVGVALMVAMLVTPPAAAYLLTNRLRWMMGLGAAIGALAGVTGLYISFYLGVASGAAIVLVATACFGLVLVVRPGQGWLWRLPWRSLGTTARHTSDSGHDPIGG